MATDNVQWDPFPECLLRPFCNLMVMLLHDSDYHLKNGPLKQESDFPRAFSSFCLGKFSSLTVSKETTLTLSIFIFCLDTKYQKENAVETSTGRLCPHQFSISRVLRLSN